MYYYFNKLIRSLLLEVVNTFKVCNSVNQTTAILVKVVVSNYFLSFRLKYFALQLKV
jgi:hypothetical protein